MHALIIAIHILLAFGIITLVLLQQGRGAEAGGGFGSGASNTVFGAPGGGNILSHVTAVMVAVFFATSLGLAIFAKLELDSSSAEQLEQLADDLGENSPVEALKTDEDSERGEDQVPDFPDQ